MVAIRLVLKSISKSVFIIENNHSLRKFHKALVKKLEVFENIIFTGRIQRKKVPYFDTTYDVFVIPYVVEAFGLVTTETMACGKPEIGTNVGMLPRTASMKHPWHFVLPFLCR